MHTNQLPEHFGVLVLDDDPQMRRVVRAMLFTLGVKRVREFGDAAKAIEEMEHFHADLIILDLHMKPMNGIEFLRLVRRTEGGPNPCVPIIMLTGDTECRRVYEARDAGVDHFLAKPVSAATLNKRIASIVKQQSPTKTFFGPDRRRKDLGPPTRIRERRNQRDKRGEALIDPASLLQKEIESFPNH